VFIRLDKLIASLFPRDILFSCIQSGGLLPNYVSFTPYRSAAQDFQLSYWHAYLYMFYYCCNNHRFRIKFHYVSNDTCLIARHVATCPLSLKTNHWLPRIFTIYWRLKKMYLIPLTYKITTFAFFKNAVVW